MMRSPLAIALLVALPSVAAAQHGQPDIQGFWRPVVDGASHSVEEGPEPANANITGQRDRKRQTIVVGGGADDRAAGRLAPPCSLAGARYGTATGCHCWYAAPLYVRCAMLAPSVVLPPATSADLPL